MLLFRSSSTTRSSTITQVSTIEEIPSSLGFLRIDPNVIAAVNITETKEEFKLAFAVPGMKKDDFDVNVDGNMLTVSCEKEESKEDKEHQYTRKEYNYSSFSRSFSLPDEVSKDNIHASYTDGVLYLQLPKKEEAKKLLTKSITVK
jgi:HSP20 family protein